MSTYETGTEDLLLERHGDHIAVVTLNRPERRNALSEPMYQALAEILPQLGEDSTVRVVMITGAGGAFCAGGDVKAMNERNRSGAKANRSRESAVAGLRRRQRGVTLALRNLPQPVVAAIDGPVAGAGFSIALAADLRVASESAIVVPAFSSVGGSGDFGGSWLLSQLVGPAKAKELYFFSPRLSAGEAAKLGILNQVYGDDEFQAKAFDYCQRLAERAPIALQQMKENFNRGATLDLPTALDLEATAMIHTMSTEDHKEAAAAFVEKRSPTFKGR